MKWDKVFKLPAALLFTLCVAGLLLKAPPVLRGLGLNLSLFQMVVFPFFILLILQWRLLGISLPRQLVLAGALFTLLTVACSFINIGANSRTIVIARLEGDDFEIESRLFKEKFKSLLYSYDAGEKINVARHFSSLPVKGDPAKFWEMNPGPLALVWGNQRWLGVSFDPQDAVFLPSEAFAAWSEKIGMKLVTSVSWLGLSFMPKDDTARFLAALFSALPLSNLNSILSSPEAFEETVGKLEEAGDMRAHWTMLAHSSYPYWVLGNLYLARALQGGGFNSSDMAQAQRWYRQAKAVLKVSDNPELYGAITNNAAVGRYIQGLVERRSEHRKSALREFQAVASYLQRKGMKAAVYRVGTVAKGNLGAMKKFSKELSARKKKNGPNPIKTKLKLDGKP